METKKITPFYKHDHDELDGYFLKFQELKDKDYPQAKEYFKKFKFGLQRHIVWEEEILFPLFEAKTGMRDYGPTAVMRGEHRQIGEYLEAVHKKVQRNDPDSGQQEQMLWYYLKSHNEKEENMLYPAIDGQTSAEEQEKVFNAMHSLPEERYKTCCHGH
ncbi:MAG: hemerythrin domain-containing protein [Candidatus Omnitrophica bacterium]|nr:hemerythrin domain-containing protein [Candidatus Omnitrophota bacterium]MDE2009844.1 hemerythrin domain-containing protein [Candidatus Omnitrophota bacterium]MDE2214375.1 hemerythrin domain-containing protein [Candidatus Omnitrophota bacterium]MDE2231124.1 hemerythrin domain-containing protein [Candidatus Omnitrophota bacterium]